MACQLECRTTLPPKSKISTSKDRQTSAECTSSATELPHLTEKATTGALRAPVGRGRRPRPVVVFVFVVFIWYFLGFGQVLSTFTCPPMDKPVSPMIISASGVLRKPEKCQKMAEMYPEKCSGGIETLGWIEIALRIQWKASRTPKRP